MPIVTAVNGAAAGVGMSFAIIGDIVCASKSAFFLQAFARIGLVPDGGATFMLPRLIGWGRALELSLLAERLPAEKAEAWGLVNRVYEDNEALMDGAMEDRPSTRQRAGVAGTDPQGVLGHLAQRLRAAVGPRGAPAGRGGPDRATTPKVYARFSTSAIRSSTASERGFPLRGALPW